MLSAIDMAEDAPSPADTTRGLRALNQMLDAWAAEGLNVVAQTLTGTTTSASAVISSLTSTAKLAIGMNVAGTGIQITLDTVATASGSVSLAFEVVPFQPRYEEGVAALLALRVALLIGEDNIPAMVVRLANNGWAQLSANFMRTPEMGFDVALLDSYSRRTSAIVDSD